MMPNGRVRAPDREGADAASGLIYPDWFRRFRKIHRDWRLQAPWRATGKAFPETFPGLGLIRGGRPGGPAASPDSGLHFFLYLRRDFLYYFR